MSTVTKTCPACHQEKALGEFHRDASNRDGRACWCKVCFLSSRKGYYRQNRTELIARSESYRIKHKKQINKRFRQWRQERRRALKSELLKTFGGKCQVCGYDACNDALEFHHPNPEIKEICITTLITNNAPLEDIVKEASKCQLLCCRCHREIHATSDLNTLSL